MSLGQRADEDLAQIMTPEEFEAYKALERKEARAENDLYWSRKEMREMRAKVRARHKRKNKV